MATETDAITPEDLLKSEKEKPTKPGKDDTEKPPREKTEKEIERENERLKAKTYTVEQENIRLKSQLEAALAEKRKPGITVVREDGQQEHRKRPNSWGLSDLIMPPYTKGRTAIYRICGAEELNPATGLKVEPVDVMVPGRYTLYDKFEKDPLKKDKTMKNIVGTERYVDDGEEKIREVIDDVLFTRGWLQVPVESDFPLYVFMELHPNNATNKHRQSNAPKIFERIDIQHRSPAYQGAALELSVDAGSEILKKMTKEDVLAYAAAVKEISTSANRPIHEIRTDLARWAMNNPIPYFQLNKNAKAAIQINILQAIDFGIIGYRVDKRGYCDLETDEVFCVHTAAEEPMDRLVKFLASEEGKERYQVILSRLNYWSNE